MSTSTYQRRPRDGDAVNIASTSTKAKVPAESKHERGCTPKPSGSIRKADAISDEDLDATVDDTAPTYQWKTCKDQACPFLNVIGISLSVTTDDVPRYNVLSALFRRRQGIPVQDHVMSMNHG